MFSLIFKQSFITIKNDMSIRIIIISSYKNIKKKLFLFSDELTFANFLR
jgi:hypothetical protein